MGRPPRPPRPVRTRRSANGRALIPEQKAELRRTYGVPPLAGDFWYDPHSGLRPARAGHSAVPSDTIPGGEAPEGIRRLNVPAQFHTWHPSCLTRAVVTERDTHPPETPAGRSGPGPRAPVDEEHCHDDDH
jgi:hypothetical protein